MITGTGKKIALTFTAAGTGVGFAGARYYLGPCKPQMKQTTSIYTITHTMDRISLEQISAIASSQSI